MCQLLGMNCNVPTDICFSFAGFQVRGGATDVHSDGWGIAFFEGRGTRVFLDPQPSCSSPVAALVCSYPIRSENVIAHIRKATQGLVALENTHPFMRELWGRCWIFAHNGHLPDFSPTLDGSFTPVGQTDSERAFCWLLQELRERFGSRPPSRERLFDALHQLTLELGARGACNYLLSNGDCLFAHCSTQLTYIIRQAPFAVAHLRDQDLSIDFSAVTTPDDRVAVIATVPLTDNEQWTTMPPGSLWLFEGGAPVRHRLTVAAAAPNSS
ncbi:class II glutamine amidotransferase [Candidatus Accumulibacter sp. ACC003]|uniref:class II glutamine amidotransferase n=1 Tax=Candidatus Accumulibacter sp. ACC003 TaxID=2823334 RepID=UPI0025C43DBC|nr:class II glutamine amidotransferase [Candidatus Accumulibacter sp. ACC003]